MLSFALVGVFGAGLNSSVLWLLTERAHLYYLASSAVATQVAILSNFALNQRWTFASLGGEAPILPRLARFQVVSLGGLVLTVVGLFVLTHFAGLHYLTANAGAICLGATWNYVANRRWTWGSASTAAICHARENGL